MGVSVPTAAMQGTSAQWTEAESVATKIRTIKEVEEVNETVPKGTLPRLPYQLWTTYSDGKSEYRQVRWSNSGLREEQSEANERTVAGTQYTIQGYIIGDNTTGNGYPIVAKVTVTDEAWDVPDNNPIAEPLPLNRVQLTGDNRLTHNRDLDINHLLSLDVSQQLYNYRDTYGLPTEGYTVSDGWDSPTTKLKGHGSGHYMSALAFAYSCCTDKGKKAKLKSRIKRMVDELRACQERTFVYDKKLGRYREARDLAPEAELREMKGAWEDFDNYKKDYKNYGYGYLNAIPAQHCALIEMYRAYNNESWVWAPYYSVHKQLAGLIDIATYVDDKKIADKALRIATDMGLWVWNRLHFRTYVKSDGTQEERRQKPGNRYEMWNMYIAGEVGGIQESLARLSEMNDDAAKKARLLEAANCFDSPAFYDPLAKNIDAIRTRHANQHIPMVVGALRSYRSNNQACYYNLAENFWTMIQGRYRYSTGGVGNGEMFRQPYTQVLSMCTNSSSLGDGKIVAEPTLNETCCAYNLAKLSKDLNCFRPDDAKYMDYYERVLYNQIVGSVNPNEYATTYQYAVGLNASKPWGNETPQSSCCGGTGTENHLKYQEAAYFVNDSTIWVALYMPTIARWDAKKITLRQECLWPAEKSVIRITEGSGVFAMKLRVPYWATNGFEVRLNGATVAMDCKPCSYVEIAKRKWSKEDVVEVTMPFTKHIDFGPDKMRIAVAPDGKGNEPYTPLWTGTFMYGPLVMSTTGIGDWQAATVDVRSDLSDVALLGARQGIGADANLYQLSFGGHVFIPDYAADRNCTHYFRMRLEECPDAAFSVGDEELMDEGVDKTQLAELMQDARARRDAQSRWNALTVKVPEYAPWAKHAFRRMMEQYDKCNEILHSQDTSLTQAQVDEVAAALNAALNTMRPGNLPELEDLHEVIALLKQAKASQKVRTKAFRQSIDYAEMVVSYVNDGSGTMDMIVKATDELKTILGLQ